MQQQGKSANFVSHMSKSFSNLPLLYRPIAAPSYLIDRRRVELIQRQCNHNGRQVDGGKRSITRDVAKPAGTSKQREVEQEGAAAQDTAEDGEMTWTEYAVFAALSVPAAVGILYLLKHLGILDPYLGSTVQEMEPKYGNMRETQPRAKS